MRVKWLGQEYDAIPDVGKLLGAEVIATEKHFGCDLDDMTGFQAGLMVTFFSIKRHHPKLQWDAVEGLTIDELNDLVIIEPGDEPEIEAPEREADPSGADEAASPSDSPDTSSPSLMSGTGHQAPSGA